MVTLIVAMGLNGEIGKDNQLLWSIPSDMKHFREYTTGKSVVMGSKTHQSIGRYLPNRQNIVVSRQAPKDDNHVTSIQEAFNKATAEIVVIGGAEIYNQTIDLADKLVITKVNRRYPDADVYFPEINYDDWKLSMITSGEDNGYTYSIIHYDRCVKQKF